MIGHKTPSTSRQHINNLKAQLQAEEDARLDALIPDYKKRVQERNLRRNSVQKLNHAIPAIRAWTLSDNFEYLKALSNDYIWDGPVNRNEVAPTWRSHHGFWAVKPSGIPIIDSYIPDVVGVVELSGRVVEHTHGWRGEVCAIRGLFLLNSYQEGLGFTRGKCELLDKAIIRLLENRYQCEVGTLESIYHVTGRLLK